MKLMRYWLLCWICIVPLAYGSSASVAAPSCLQPVKPSSFNRTMVARFRKQVDDYKQCITDYVNKNNKLAEQYDKKARAHQNASVKAMKAWNDFVGTLS